jgi:hypothetical protein
MSWLVWKLLGVAVVIVGVLSAWFILGGLAQSLRSRKGSRGFLFWLAVAIGIAGVFIAIWLLSSSGGVMVMH